MPAFAIEDVRLPNGVMVRVRAPGSGDEAEVKRLFEAVDAVRIGTPHHPAAGSDGWLVAEQPWSGEIVGYAGWQRLSGARAAAGVVVAHELGRTPLAAHMLVRLARLADQALIPTLIVAPLDLEAPSGRFVRAVFDVDGEPAELRTVDWEEALARVRRIDRVPSASSLARASTPVDVRALSGSRWRHGVVVAGGGVAALECLMALRDLAGPEVPIRVVAPDEHFVYRPLQVAEPFAPGTVRRYPLADIAADFGAELLRGAAVEVRPDAHALVTDGGSTVPYDALVLAPGARPAAALPGAVTVGQPGASDAIRAILAGVGADRLSGVAFVAPRGTTWTLPLYELALMTAASVRGRGARLSLVSPEPRPLAVFGPPVSARIADLLAHAGIEFHGSSYAAADGPTLRLEPGGRELPVDRVIALPELRGPAIPGVPADGAGFIPVDRHGRVDGVRDVYAAGDATAFPVKQGGLAAQQADAVAEAVAAAFGAEVSPRPFKPVLRGLLFTGGDDRFLRAGIGGGEGDGTVDTGALWWPPTKVAGLYLAPYLFRRDEADAEAPTGFTHVSVALDE